MKRREFLRIVAGLPLMGFVAPVVDQTKWPRLVDVYPLDAPPIGNGDIYSIGDGNIYYRFKMKLLAEGYNMPDARLYVAFVAPGPVVDDNWRAFEVAGPGYEAGGMALTNVAWEWGDEDDPTTRLTADDVTWRDLDAGELAYAVLYNQEDDFPIGRWWIGTNCNKGDLTIEWPNGVVFAIS